MDNQQQNEDDPQQQRQQQPVLRSIHNRLSSFVRFINTTRRNVSVYWIDYQGKRICYRVLSCMDYLDINTFVTHPWIFEDKETKDRFPANGQEVYFPESWFAKYEGLRQSALPSRIERVEVYITLPLLSLRDLCLREIKRRLRYDQHAFGLEIPWSLQRDLYNMHPKKPNPNEKSV